MTTLVPFLWVSRKQRESKPSSGLVVFQSRQNNANRTRSQAVATLPRDAAPRGGLPLASFGVKKTSTKWTTRLGERSKNEASVSTIVLELRPQGKTRLSNRCRRTRNQITARRSGAEANGEESGGVIQRSQVTFEATITTRITVSIEKKTRAPGSTAFGIQSQRRRLPRK